MPQRLYSVANVFAQRCLLSYTSKGQLPDLEFFNLKDMCSRENPIPEVNLNNLPLEFYRTESDNIENLLNPYIISIENNICRTVFYK